MMNIFFLRNISFYYHELELHYFIFIIIFNKNLVFIHIVNPYIIYIQYCIDVIISNNNIVIIILFENISYDGGLH